MSTNFAIAKIQKIQSLKDLNNATLHGRREDKSTHFDPSRTRYNRHWFMGGPSAGPADWAAGVKGVLAWNKAAVRRGAPVAAEILVSASGPFFEGDAVGEWPMIWSKVLIDAWVEVNMQAFEARFPGAIAAARLDMDEGTPHLTLCVVPLYGKKVGTRLVPTVSFRKVFGGETKEDARQAMIGFQDWYASRMKPLGLARGVAKAMSGRVGLTHQDYRQIKQRQDLETQAALDSALELEERAAADADEAMGAILRATAKLEHGIAQLRVEKSTVREAAQISRGEAIQLLKKARKYFSVAQHHMAVLKKTTGEMHAHAAEIERREQALIDLARETDDILSTAMRSPSVGGP